MRLIFILFIPYLLLAQSIEVLYKKVVLSNIYKSKEAKIQSTLHNTQTRFNKDVWSVGAGLGYADNRDGSNAGSEYAFQIGKIFTLNNTIIDNLMQKSTQYASLQKKVIQNRLKIKLWRAYGNYCITMQALQSKAELASVYDDIRGYIHKGVEYGEFDSGKEIMATLALENLNLQISKLENSVQYYESVVKMIVPFDGQFECKSEKTSNIQSLFDFKNSAIWPMLEKKITNTKLELGIAQYSTRQLSVNANYTREIDTDRYIVNFVVPLNVGAKNEALIAQNMSNLRAIEYEQEVLKNSYMQESLTLKNRLEIYTKYLLSSEKLIKKSADKLIKQSNMRFLAGEESLISMLKSTETKLQMIETILELKLNRHNAVTQYMYNYAVNPEGINK